MRRIQESMGKSAVGDGTVPTLQELRATLA
jgi:hypothetical protein